MAYSERPLLINIKAATTVSSTQMYRACWATSTGGVIVGDPGTTGAGGQFAGICYGYTRSTSTDSGEKIPVAVGGVVKVACAANTVGEMELISVSSNGWGCANTTKNRVIGRVIEGSSGGAGQVKSVLLFGTIPLVYSARLISTTG